MTSTSRCVDSGVIIASFASWHEHHDRARQVLAGAVQVVAHSLLETYSVLTRLPAPFRAPADVVVEFLGRSFPQPPLAMPANETQALLASLVNGRILGGAVYDALIGATAAAAGCTLVTLDARALRTYLAVGCAAELL